MANAFRTAALIVLASCVISEPADARPGNKHNGGAQCPCWTSAGELYLNIVDSGGFVDDLGSCSAVRGPDGTNTLEAGSIRALGHRWISRGFPKTTREPATEHSERPRREIGQPDSGEQLCGITDTAVFRLPEQRNLARSLEHERITDIANRVPKPRRVGSSAREDQALWTETTGT